MAGVPKVTIDTKVEMDELADVEADASPSGLSTEAGGMSRFTSQESIYVPEDLAYFTFGRKTFDALPANPEVHLRTVVAAEKERERRWRLRACNCMSAFRYCSGTMQQAQKWISKTHIPGLIFLDCCLRGMGQCMFCNNPITGLFVLAGAALNSRYAACMGLAGLLGATATAYNLVLDVNMVRNGLFSLTGFLLGLVLALFHHGGDEHWVNMPWEFVPAVILGGLSSFLVCAYGNLTVPVLGLAPLGWPFVTCAYLWIMACTGGLFSYFPIQGKLLSPALLSNPAGFVSPPAHLYSADAIWRSFFMNIGNAAFSGYEWSGALFLAGILVCSPISAGMAVLGSTLAMAFELAFGVAEGMVSTGLIGFNCVLTALALGGNFLILRGYRVWISIVVGIFFAFLLTAGLTSAFKPLGQPVLGLPFTISVWTMLLCARGVPGLVSMPLNLMTVPENHVELFKELDEKAQAESRS